MTLSKNILITGCSSGIGRCLAEGLQARGYRVFATSRKVEDVALLRAQGLESVQLDVSDSASIQQAVQEILIRTSGKIYALINNAGYGQPGAVEDLRRDVLREQFETNVFGVLELTNALLPVMRAQQEGRIINISSLLGLVALPFRGAYNASKFALEGLTDTLRLELRSSGIFVSLIEPGPIRSRFRPNSFIAYQKNIRPERSAHRAKYRILEQRLTKSGTAMAFTLTPEAVLKKVIHALESSRPKPRYYVTLPTHMAALLKRVLPHRVLDWVLHRLGGDGGR
ncbi:MAG: SDR family NAD(P)-dependent oxidoreductase [Gammaproteobacteria bacterium]